MHFPLQIGVSIEGFPRQVQGLWGHLAIGLVSVLQEADTYVFIRGNTCEKMGGSQERLGEPSDCNSSLPW